MHGECWCGEPAECGHCGGCRECCDCDTNGTFDADELGLDPEEDDQRRYGPDVQAQLNLYLTLWKLGVF